MEKIIEDIKKLEEKIKTLEEENMEMKQIIKELQQYSECNYCEYSNSLYTCIGCARKICRRCCIINHTKAYNGEPICEIICKYCR
jgi:hypothetical protein